MIPSIAPASNLSFEIVEQPTETYKMDLKTGKNIRGYTDKLEAMKQVVFKILNTERYQLYHLFVELRD